MQSSRFLKSTAIAFTHALARAMISEQTAHENGILQSLDPRVRVIGLLSLVVAVTLSRKLIGIGVLFGIAVTLAVLSKVRLATLAKRVWLVVLGFTTLMAVPATFITPGDVVATLAGGKLQVTAQGLRTAALLIARVETAVAFTTLLVLCTEWFKVLKALRMFGVPQEIILMLTMTHRYIFLLVETASQMFESRESRTVGVLKGPEQRRMVAGTAGVLLSKSVELSNEVYQAMQSRGFQGDVRTLSDFRLQARDYLGLFAFMTAVAVSVWVGR